MYIASLRAGSKLSSAVGDLVSLLSPNPHFKSILLSLCVELQMALRCESRYLGKCAIV